MLKSYSPAACLAGLVLERGWKVVKKLSRAEGHTGGVFSQSYIVQNNTRKGFMKALDFSAAFEPGVDTVRVLNMLTSAFEYERDVLKICSDLRLSNVVLAIDHGYVEVPNFDRMSGKVYYLVFELANGDIRGQVDEVKKFDTYWSLLALKDVCLGLFQVHRQMIAHQDMKPSNVLHYGKEGFRIADFGRSSMKGRTAWYDSHSVAGDKTYSPPELIYGYTHSDFSARRFGCDLYMLGNLVAFMFAGVNVTSSLLCRIDQKFHPNNWHGTYEQVLPYIQRGFGELLQEIKSSVDYKVEEFAVRIISELCNPDILKRGHPKGIGRPQQHSLERYVSILDMACRRFVATSRLSAGAK